MLLLLLLLLPARRVLTDIVVQAPAAASTGHYQQTRQPSGGLWETVETAATAATAAKATGTSATTEEFVGAANRAGLQKCQNPGVLRYRSKFTWKVVRIVPIPR
jgi:hypothetical protein